jgi:lipoprotein-releasing system permease protein
MAIVQGYQQEVPKLLETFSGQAQIIPARISASTESGSMVLPANQLQSIQRNENIQCFYPYALKAGITQTESEFEGIVLQGVGSGFPSERLKTVLLQGRAPSFSHASKECAIPEPLAKKLGLKIGATLPVIFVQQPPRTRAFTIVGIFKNPMEHETGRPVVLVPIHHVQAVNGWESATVGGYQIQFKSGTNIQAEVDEIHNQLPLTLEAFSLGELFPQLFQWLALFDTNQSIILVIMLAVAGLNMMSALVLLVLEKKKEVGLLRALGLPTASVAGLFRWWSLRLVARGLLFGNLLAGGILFSQHHFHWLSLDEKLYYLSYAPVSINPMAWGITNLGIALFCWLSMMLPSRVVSKLDIIESLKN